MKLFTTRCLIFVLLAFSTLIARSQIFSGTNAPGSFQDFNIDVGPQVTNLSIVLPGNSTNFSYLFLKKGVAPTESSYDFIALASGSNFINLEVPEFTVTNYVLRVQTPTNSDTHGFNISVQSNLTDFRTAVRPATKPLAAIAQNTITSNSWQYFRIDVPTNLPGWRIVLHTTNQVNPDLYLQTNSLPASTGSTNYLKRSTGSNPDTLTFTNNEAAPGVYFVGVFLPGTTNIVRYTLTLELAGVSDLTWDPGTTHRGTQGYTNQSATGGDYYFRIIPQNTALGAWRTALNVESGEAHVYLLKGALPTPSSATYKSERVGSDGFVVPASAFQQGQEWFLMVRADPNAQWNLVTGEPFSLDLGMVAADSSSSITNVQMGAEGMRYFRTTVPLDLLGWRLWLNGLTNAILLKKGSVPVPGVFELSQNGQMLVVPPYLIGGLQYFIGVAGAPGLVLNVDSRQHTVSDINFISSTSLSVTGYPYSSYRVQVPLNQVAWQISVLVTNGNPNVAVRRNFVPNEANNDAYSEVPGAITDSLSLVPPTLSDGTFYITVYSTNNHTFTLNSGMPVVTDINFTNMITNDDPNRAGWRYYRITDFDQQLGTLGWDLLLQNFAPGTRIAIRRNAVPSLWNSRNNGVNSSSGFYTVLSPGPFLQNPAHQADVWYVGVYSPNAALGPFTLITGALTAEPMGFGNDTRIRTDVPSGKWQFFQFTVPTNTMGWDLRFLEVVNGAPRIAIRRDQLPTGWTNLTSANSTWNSPGNNFSWPSGYQWRGEYDWTHRSQSADGEDELGRIHAMGMGQPLEAGVYYVGVIDVAGSNSMSYTLMSRGIGPGFPIPVSDLAYSGGSAGGTLAAREAAYYRVEVPTNMPSWKMRVVANNGEVELIVLTNHIPNPESGRSSFGKLMQKVDNEHYLLLPQPGKTTIPGGTYYLAVVSEGVAPNGLRIGTATSSYTLTSEGPLPILDLGTLGASSDITHNDSLDGGEVKAYRFSTAASTLAWEMRLEDKVGNPVMVAIFGDDLPYPGTQSQFVGGDPYGNDGGLIGTASSDLITCANCNDSSFSVVVKARGSQSVYPDANYVLRLHAVGVEPLAFNGGSSAVAGQGWGTFRYFQVDVPADALGWDIRLKDVIGNGVPRMVIARDFLSAQADISFGFTNNPGTCAYWPSDVLDLFGAQWAVSDDWTRRGSSAAGASELYRVMAMGMGRPLAPGSYIVGVQNDTQVAAADATYTIESRGIGSSYLIPVTDLDFFSGAASHPGLLPRQAAYYRVDIPDGAPSWRVKVSTNAGEVMLLVLSNNIPNVDTGRGPVIGKCMQKLSSEHFVLLPTNGQTQLPGGPYYMAVVSEGMSATNPARIGVGQSSFSIQSLGPLGVTNLGMVNTSTDILYSVTGQEGGEVRGFQFSVPSGLSSVEVRLENRVGNPIAVVRQGAELPYPGSGASGSAEEYGNQGGYQVLNTFTNAGASATLVTIANPQPGTYSMVVKARAFNGIYSNANYTVRVSALAYTDLAFDCGAVPTSNHLAGTWRYFRVVVPENVLGWDVRLTNVTNGVPKMVVRRESLPISLNNVGWQVPGNATNWAEGNQWAANTDWTARPNSAASVNENFRILAMGTPPLEPGTYYIGVNNSGTTSNLSYTIRSRGIGDNLCLPITDLAFNGGSHTNSGMPARETAYYRIQIPSNAPSLKVRVASTGGELMLAALIDKVPSVDAGRNNTVGKFMQKAGNEHFLLLPGGSQNFLTPGTLYLVVVSEGVNPPSGSQTGNGTISYVITCQGSMPVYDMGTIGTNDLVRADSLEGGECKAYRITIPPGMVLETRLENRVGNPVMTLRGGTQIANPGQPGLGISQDDYGNQGSALLGIVATNNITVPAPSNTVYTLVVKARGGGTTYADATYTVRARQVTVTDLNFSSEQNTNGLSNVASGLLADNQRAFYRVVVPPTNNGLPVIGWRLDVSQSSGVSSVRVRPNLLPDDAIPANVAFPFTFNTAVVAPPYLTNGTWYVEVRGSNSTAFTLVSRAVVPERPIWAMPQIGQPTTTPGLVAPNFGDTGLDTNGVALPGDQGIDLAQGSYHFYGVKVPGTNSGIMRVQLTAISGNPDVYIRTNVAPTVTHQANGAPSGSVALYDRSLASSVTEYGNFVPLSGRTEFELLPGNWYLAVRASGNANARYRLRLSAGVVQDLVFNGGSATGQVVAGNDWRYYRVQFPPSSPTNWWVTFNQQAGDVVMYVRDTVPPGNGTSVSDIRDWSIDNKNTGPYPSYNLPGTYLLATPQLRPGALYYLGFKANNDAIFTISNNVGAGNFPLYPSIEFYGGSVSNVLAPFAEVIYHIYTPRDGVRWKHTSTHIPAVNLYLENGFLPTKGSNDDWRSTTANSPLSQLLNTWPWQPNSDYYLTITNTTASPQNYAFVMDGRNAATDDNDLDGMPDAWERFYFAGSTSPTAAGDFDSDGVSNLNEYLEATNPADPTSLRPRLNIIATNGIVNVNPASSNYTYGAAVSLTPIPNAGYIFLGWGASASGTNIPLNLTMTNTRTVSAIFRAPGDDFAQRILITGWSNTVTSANTNATKELTEPTHAGNPGARSIWWTWTPLSSGNVTISTEGSSFNTLLAVYTGTNVGNLTGIAANDNFGTNQTSTVTFAATAGVAYSIAVDGFDGASGNVNLQVREDNPPILIGSAVRLGNGTFQFTVEAEPGYNYDIQASTNLFTWVTIATVPNPTGLIQFIDANAPLYSMRFYRAVRGDLSAQLSLKEPVHQGNSFAFVVLGPTGAVVRVQMSTNLLNWQTVTTLTNTIGKAQFTDPTASPFDRRFYRAVSP